ncbi:MAG: hypothetical protein KF792_09650 [Chelatococcus sp.]|nr:hypothetical protein [Chelatococcus sp. YT9]MBX3556507.1 hypothetical protein [Chelatococcus sp.]
MSRVTGLSPTSLHPLCLSLLTPWLCICAKVTL